ncbi:MAG: major facilitator superfamily 1 [Firmicutes bacterium]|nr:major facilitator superfamily 1 [Bacillota bacterium]
MKLQLTMEKTATVVVMTAYFLTPFMTSAVNLIIPAIGTEFFSQTLLLSWLVTGYSLATAAFLLPFGKLSDIIGRKRVFIIGMFLFSLFTLLSGVAWSIWWMILFRICQGIASAMIYSTGMAIITSIYPPHRRGQVLGLCTAVAYIGLSLGPSLGGLISHYFSWRVIFYLTGFASVLATLLAAWRLRGEWTGAKGESFDFQGSVCYVLALALSLFGFSSLAQTEWAIYCLCIGLVLMVYFFVYESKQACPLLRIQIFHHNSAFAYCNLAAMINYSATFAIAFLVSLQLQLVMKCDSYVAGLIMISQPLITALLAPLGGYLADHFDPRVVTSYGMALSAVGLFSFSLVTSEMSLWLIAGSLAIAGAGFALFAAPNNSAIMGAVDKSDYGVASSIAGTMRNIGQSISMAIVTLVMSVYLDGIDAVSYNHMLVTCFRTAYIIFTVICIAGVFCCRRGKRFETKAEVVNQRS